MRKKTSLNPTSQAGKVNFPDWFPGRFPDCPSRYAKPQRVMVGPATSMNVACCSVVQLVQGSGRA